jgi:gas vesicle protein
MNKPVNYTLGFLSGALVGSVVALLYAPENGRDIRDTLSYRVNSYIDDLNHLIDRLSYEKGNISDAKEKGDKVVKDARKRAENLIHEVEDLLNSIEEAKKGTANKENGEPS